MAWFKSDHIFGNRSAIFYVTAKQMYMEQEILLALQETCGPDKLEAACLGLIGKYRPEIEGCVLFAMGFNQQWQRWEFSVDHGSLPRHSLGEKIQARPLDPAYERDLVETASLGMQP